MGGHIAFLVVVFGLAGGLIGPFTSFKFGAEWRAAIPDWFSLHGKGTAVMMTVVIAYPVCVGGAMVLWAINERAGRRYIRKPRT